MKKIFSTRMLSMLLIGYSAGLPLLLIGSTLQAWMTDEGVDLTAIGLVSLLGLPYVFKFLWAPLLDRYKLPFMSRRKGWMLLFQILLVLCILGLSLTNPKTDINLVCVWAFLIALFSASQDVVLDAYRREILPDEELGLGSSLYITGYRLAMLVSGALALILADTIPWKDVYMWLAVFMAPAILFTFLAPKENHHIPIPANLKAAVVGPLKDFFTRKGAWIMLLFILMYKVGDSMASNMTTPFILDIGYSKTDIGTVAKTFGMVATILGGILGGTMMLRMNMRYSLIVFGVLQAVSTLGFSILPSMPVAFMSLATIIAFENLASGMGTAAYSAYMASLTNKQFTATQYALLTALMGIPRVILASPTGWMAKQMGWEMFFVVCTFVALPGLLLLIPVFRLEKPAQKAAI
ncbi:AmpG family muropeptide MFS transporter [Peredibacter sp. HCB2-198]|uniref:AmpG family muropeptide MFS transporter n=1 Tax=Peredibacter sp. HCB2-198 TaxID=3383025 RepID=UPI0038B4399F